ncbi:hypothetical protein GZH46_02471, partial [Fragariocoptes setiger]
TVNGAPAQSTRPDPINCTNHLDTIDRCSSLSTYSFVTSFNPYPRSANEVKQSCQRINDGLKCIKVQSKCLSSVARRSLQSFANGRSRHSKKLCANPDGEASKKFYQTFDCILRNKGGEFAKSERDIIQSIEAITKAKLAWKDRFNHACCAASNFKETYRYISHKSIIDSFPFAYLREKRSLKDIGPQCVAFRSTAEEMVDSIVGELLDTACPDQQRLRQVCPSLGKLEPAAGTWKAVSLTRAALELVIVLSNTSGEDV